MSIYLIDKIKPKNNGTFKIADAKDIDFDNFIVPKDSLDLSDYYVKAETDEAIRKAVAESGHLMRVILADDENLPTENIDIHTIYMKKDINTENDIYIEYMYINSKWEVIGSSRVDLTPYLKIEDANKQLSNLEATLKADATTKADKALSDAKKYSDNNLSTAKKYSDTNLQAAKDYSDNNLQTAKNYSDANLATAKSYSDDNLQGAKDYTDTEIANGLIWYSLT